MADKTYQITTHQDQDAPPNWSYMQLAAIYLIA